MVATACVFSAPVSITIFPSSMATAWEEPTRPFTTASIVPDLPLDSILTTTIVTFSVYGYPTTPCAITDAAGNSAVIMVRMAMATTGAIG